MKQWSEISQRIKPFAFLESLSKYPLVNWLSRKYLIYEVTQAWEVTVGFIAAYKVAKRKFFTLLSKEQNIAQSVYGSIRKDIDEAILYLNELNKIYKDIIPEIQTVKAVDIVLRRLDGACEKSVESGDLEEKEYERIVQMLDHAHIVTNHRLTEIKPITPIEMMSRNPIFYSIGTESEEIIQKLAKIVRINEYELNETIFVQGHPSDGFLIMQRGTAKVTFNQEFRKVLNNNDDDFGNETIRNIHSIYLFYSFLFFYFIFFIYFIFYLFYFFFIFFIYLYYYRGRTCCS